MVGGGICGYTLLWLKKYTLLVEETHSLGSRNTLWVKRHSRSSQKDEYDYITHVSICEVLDKKKSVNIFFFSPLNK